jgi:hypothetical protein
MRMPARYVRDVLELGDPFRIWMTGSVHRDAQGGNWTTLTERVTRLKLKYLRSWITDVGLESSDIE